MIARALVIASVVQLAVCQAGCTDETDEARRDTTASLLQLQKAGWAVRIDSECGSFSTTPSGIAKSGLGEIRVTIAERGVGVTVPMAIESKLGGHELFAEKWAAPFARAHACPEAARAAVRGLTADLMVAELLAAGPIPPLQLIDRFERDRVPSRSPKLGSVIVIAVLGVWGISARKWRRERGLS